MLMQLKVRPRISNGSVVMFSGWSNQSESFVRYITIIYVPLKIDNH